MIGYHITKSDLEALIEAAVPGWLQKAAERTETFRRQGQYEEKSSIWSEVKPEYMKLQGDCKCAYCERKLEPLDFGKVEQDVEHFRPKSNVRAWTMPKHLRNLGITATAVPDEKSGYYLLPYHLFNYCAACKPCNSSLKKDHFPIAGQYDFRNGNPEDLRAEQPYLIYPIGDIDKDPENLIRFHGISPQAVATCGHDRNRALVTIEFFKLDNLRRKNLYQERAMIIQVLYPQLVIMATDTVGAAYDDAKALVEAYTSPKAPHTNCARSYRRLFLDNPQEAEAIFHLAVQLTTKKS